ncbi:MAG: DUF3598 family protein [Xenococcaceae cyanobacterium]
MNDRLKNWDNFCEYHMGDWHGVWNTYNAERELLKSFKCIRSLHVNADRTQIDHQNHYIYSKDETETKTFGPYKKSKLNALFLNNSFSWGSTEIKFEPVFGFETGFRYKDRRASAGILYDASGLQKITIIPEHLESFPEKPERSPTPQQCDRFLGIQQQIKSDFQVSSPVETAWQPLETLAENNFTLHFDEGISISCPLKLETEEKFCFAIDWKIDNKTTHRGIRRFDSADFTNFSLTTYQNSTRSI